MNMNLNATCVKAIEIETGFERLFRIDDIRKIGHTYAVDILSESATEEQGLNLTDSLIYIQHEDRSESILTYKSVLTFIGEPCKVNLVDDLGNRIEYNTDDIACIRNCQAIDIMNRSDCRANCIRTYESILQIQFKDGTENTLTSDWSLNFKRLRTF